MAILYKQFPPTIPGGPSLFNTVPYAATPVFDVSQGTTALILLTGPVTSSSVLYASAGLFTVLIQQDSNGGHPFAWPGNFRDAGDLSSTSGTLAANTIARQTFIYNPANGNYYAVTPLIAGAA